MFKRHPRDNNPGIQVEKVNFRYPDGSHQVGTLITGSVVEAQPVSSKAEKGRRLASLARGIGSAALAKANVVADKARGYVSGLRERLQRPQEQAAAAGEKRSSDNDAWNPGVRETRAKAEEAASFGWPRAASHAPRTTASETFADSAASSAAGPAAPEDIHKVYDRVMANMGGSRRTADPWQAARGHYDTYRATTPHAAPQQPGTVYYGHNHSQM